MIAGLLAMMIAILMAATVELCESNGAGETITHNISNCNYGSNDSANLVTATYPVTAADAPAGASFDKYWRYHLTALGGSNGIDNLQVWKSAGAYVTGEDIQCNLKTSGYAQKTYATPSETRITDVTMPTADPGSANLGIAGSLTGQLTAVGYSDYWYSQAQSTSSTPPGDANQKTFTCQYDEW